MLTQEEKNSKISASMLETRKRRQNQTCVSIKFKVDRSALSKEQVKTMRDMFYEAKCIYNYALANNMIFGYSHKDFKHITKLDKDENTVPVEVTNLPCCAIQKIIDRMQDSIKGLNRLKAKGHKVGALKFKSEYKTIEFKQYGTTHYIKGNKVKLQGIKRHIKVEGLNQLKRFSNPELTIMSLNFDGYDYWIILVAYVDKSYLDRTIKEKNVTKQQYVGIDFGIIDTVSMSTGEKIDVTVKETEHISKLKKRLDNKVKCSNNWYKTKSLLNKEYARLNRVKKDKANKLVHHILSSGQIVVIQDDDIASWKDNRAYSDSAKKIQHSVLGTVKSKLKQYNQVIMLDQWFPTSRYCFECGHKHETLSKEDRVFVCPECGFTYDRDLHAAENMIQFYLKCKDAAGTVGTLKPYANIKYSQFKEVFEGKKTCLATKGRYYGFSVILVHKC